MATSKTSEKWSLGSCKFCSMLGLGYRTGGWSHHCSSSGHSHSLAITISLCFKQLLKTVNVLVMKSEGQSATFSPPQVTDTSKAEKAETGKPAKSSNVPQLRRKKKVSLNNYVFMIQSVIWSCEFTTLHSLLKPQKSYEGSIRRTTLHGQRRGPQKRKSYQTVAIPWMWITTPRAMCYCRN